MAISKVSSAWLMICSILSLLTTTSAQTTNPQNGTLPVASNAPQMQLNSQQTAMKTLFDIDPLTITAGLNASIQYLQSINILGTLVLTTPTNAPNLEQGDLAYISCDPSAYTGNLNAADTIQAAATSIEGSDPSGNPRGAIILYSSYSDFCSFTAPSNFPYQVIFTATNSSAARTLEMGLRAPGPSSASTTIQLDQATLNNGSGNALGPSPTTAVAMIILYSITGIITALFLIIIITGAVRAHRHPERYGPRNIIGRPRQSRAKGIARAMLETLPIVKFGDGEDVIKPMPAIELGDTRTEEHAPTNSPVDTGSSYMDGTRDAETKDDGEVVRTITVGGPEGQAGQSHAGTDQHDHAHDHDGHEHATVPLHDHPEATGTDNGLACSVCTDDFAMGQDVRVLPCGHKFHPECIDPWLLNVSGTCPLCRIDLRPTASRAEDGEESRNHVPDMHDVHPHMDDDGDMLDAGAMPEGSTNPTRRRTNGLSLYLQHTLNSRRMRDATPEERIAAIRGFRNANQAEGSEASLPAAGGERPRNRVTARLNRLWPHSVHIPRDQTPEASLREEPTSTSERS